jgi:hypothetical protein
MGQSMNRQTFFNGLLAWAANRHWLSCALWNAPAEEPEPCDCGGFGKCLWLDALPNWLLYRSLHKRFRNGAL